MPSRTAVRRRSSSHITHLRNMVRKKSRIQFGRVSKAFLYVVYNISCLFKLIYHVFERPIHFVSGLGFVALDYFLLVLFFGGSIVYNYLVALFHATIAHQLGIPPPPLPRPTRGVQSSTQTSGSRHNVRSVSTRDQEVNTVFERMSVCLSAINTDIQDHIQRGLGGQSGSGSTLRSGSGGSVRADSDQESILEISNENVKTHKDHKSYETVREHLQGPSSEDADSRRRSDSGVKYNYGRGRAGESPTPSTSNKRSSSASSVAAASIREEDEGEGGGRIAGTIRKLSDGVTNIVDSVKETMNEFEEKDRREREREDRDNH